jgi:hypothetical protein
MVDKAGPATTVLVVQDSRSPGCRSTYIAWRDNDKTIDQIVGVRVEFEDAENSVFVSN